MLPLYHRPNIQDNLGNIFKSSYIFRVMKKKCTVCSEEASYNIKDTSEFYCLECAEENFGDLDLLIKLEDDQPEKLVKEKIKDELEDGE